MFKNNIFVLLSTILFKVLGGLSAYFLTLVVAKEFTKTESGIFFYVLSFTLVFSVIFRFGLDTFLLKKVSLLNVLPDKHSLLSYLIFSFLFSSIPTLIVLGFIDFHFFVRSNELATILNSYSFYLVITFNFFYLMALFMQASGYPKIFVFAVNIFYQLSISCLVMLGIIDFRESFISLALIFITNFFILFLFWVGRERPSLTLKKLDVQRTLKDALSYWPYNILGLLFSHFPVLLLGYISNVDDVAIFSVANRLSMVISLVLLVVNIIISPKIAPLYESNRLDRLSVLVKKCSLLLFILCLPTFLIICFFPSDILGLISPIYTDYGTVLIVLCIGQFLNSISGSVGLVLNLCGHQRVATYVSILSFLLLLSFSLILVPMYSVIGAAIALSISISIQNVILVFLVKYKLGFYPFFSFHDLKSRSFT